MTHPSRRALILGFFKSQARGALPYRGVCEDLADQLEAAGWTITRSSSVASRLGRMIDLLRTIWTARGQYDVAQIEVFSGLAFIQAELSVALLRLLGKPVVLALHGGNLPNFARQHPRRVRRLLHAGAAVTAPSAYLRNGLRDFRDDIQLIPNALDLSAYTQRTRDPAAPRLIWLRALHTIYNPVLAVRVVERLRHEFPDLHLWMVGPDKGDGAQQQVEAAIAERGLSEAITLVGGVPKSDVPGWIDRADIFISTSNFDNSPVSLIEAMTSGACVVSTNVGGVPDLMQDGVHGLLVPPDDAEALADAVCRLLTDPALARRLSITAQEYGRQFDWGQVIPQWDALLLAAGRTASAHVGGEAAARQE